MTYQNHIVRDPAICGGQPVIRNTRVLVRTMPRFHGIFDHDSALDR